MNILITGAGGFVGARLARTLLAGGPMGLRGAPAAPIDSLLLTDRAPLPPDLAGEARVRFVQGDLPALLESGQLPVGLADAVFHLAAAVSGECEADFDLGLRSNLQATHLLLQACRAGGRRPVVVFSSSLAVYGCLPGQALPAVIEDDTLPTPQGSYGVQKFICEQLVADYTRKGFIAGRSVRLMAVSVRPGRPNGAASGFFSGMLREPLAGERARVPVPPSTPVALASPARTVEGLLQAARASDAVWGPPIGVNLPSLSTTVGEMAAALGRVAGSAATDLLDWTPDEAIARLVNTWPGHFNARRARALGLQPDPDVDSIVRDYIRENPQAVKLPLA